jgi:hypothetical protein
LPNSSAKSAAPLHLILERSPTLSRVIIVAHALAGLCAVANSWPVWLRIGLLVAVAVSAFFAYRNHILAPRFRGLSLLPDGEWEVISRAGPLVGRAAAGTVVTRWIVILYLNVEPKGRLAIPIVRDGVDPEAFRRLRVYLRVVGAVSNRDRTSG